MPGGVGGLGREPHPTRLTMDFKPWEIKAKKLEFHRNGAYDEESFSRENLFHS